MNHNKTRKYRLSRIFRRYYGSLIRSSLSRTVRSMSEMEVKQAMVNSYLKSLKKAVRDGRIKSFANFKETPEGISYDFEPIKPVERITFEFKLDL
jgi:hypothetical protein